MRTIFLAVVIALSLLSCKRNAKLSDMQWLIGTWKSASADGEFYEIWTVINDSSYTGIGFMLVKGDTLFSEMISLEASEGELNYSPTVSGQNYRKPVSFKLISAENAEYVFENKGHDFPQRIVYKNQKPDSLYARVEGMQNGIFRKEEFAMRKEK